MSISRDAASGVVLMVAGVAMFIGAQGFTLPAGMSFGAGFFPKIISSGIAVCGLLILLTDLRRGGLDPVRVDWPSILRVALLIAMIIAYGLALDPIGFHLSTGALLFAGGLYYRAGWLSAGGLAIFGTLILHFLFYSLMRIALPWGVLLPYAW